LQEFIWDENLVPGEYYQGENPLALPKLNLQFLTLHDYLLRNFKLFQLESTYEIRLVLTLPQLSLNSSVPHPPRLPTQELQALPAGIHLRNQVSARPT
jgi:hypothetical protein